MHHDIPNNSRFNSLVEIINSSYVKPEIMIDHFKKLKLAEFYQEKIVNGKSSADAAKAVDLSLSTIKRYKKDEGFKPERKSSHKTSEQKNQIYMKGVETKLRNKQIKEEINNIKKSDNLTYEKKTRKTK